MKKIFAVLAVLLGGFTGVQADISDKIVLKIEAPDVQQQIEGSRVVENFNADWLFHRGDLENIPTVLPPVDDENWQQVDVPHDFQISQPWVEPSPGEVPNYTDVASNFKSILSSRAFKAMGIGWYVKGFTPQEEMRGKRILIDFEGIMYLGDVYLNGVRIGGTDYGYVGFEIDITRLVKYGEENIIAVKADTSTPETSRWYTGGGLIRDVNIIYTDAEIYFNRHPLYITTTDNKVVNILVEVINRTRSNSVNLYTIIKDQSGKVIYDDKINATINRKNPVHEIQLEPIEIENPHLWSTVSPYLYTAYVYILDEEGNVKDSAKHRFGIRQIEYSPEFGFKLNGEKVLLKGIANHHSLGALGAAAYPKAIEKRLRLLKDFGFNHVRCSHNPYSKSFMELCDSLGILVVDELYDKWLDQFCGGRKPWMQLWPYDLPEWIKRDRNHPSVIMWSLGNELQTYSNLPFGDWGVTPYRIMKPVLQKYDDTRPITVAMHPRGRHQDTDSLPAPLVLETDIASYNYRYMYFPGDSKRYPWMMFYQSEAATTGTPGNYFEMDLDKVIGLAYWGQIDYLGESPGWPSKGWKDGVFDISLQPKPSAYLLKSIFKEEPIVHIGIVDKASRELQWNGINVATDLASENWNREEGSKVSMYVYTNAERVAIVVNGKVVAEKQNTMNPKSRNKMRFDNIAYEPGYLEAVAYNGDKVVATHRIETAGKTKKLVLEAEDNIWRADDNDLMHVRVYAVDSKGRRVWNEYGKLQFMIEGDAEIVAVDNGDIYSNELHVGNERSLFAGSALVILKAGNSPGKVTLTATLQE